MQIELRASGYIAKLHKARKGFKCCQCGNPIEPGSEYYSVVRGGGGLGWIKFPDRCHPDCLEQYLKRWNGELLV